MRTTPAAPQAAAAAVSAASGAVAAAGVGMVVGAAGGVAASVGVAALVDGVAGRVVEQNGIVPVLVSGWEKLMVLLLSGMLGERKKCSSQSSH